MDASQIKDTAHNYIESFPRCIYALAACTGKTTALLWFCSALLHSCGYNMYTKVKKERYRKSAVSSLNLDPAVNLLWFYANCTMGGAYIRQQKLKSTNY